MDSSTGKYLLVYYLMDTVLNLNIVALLTPYVYVLRLCTTLVHHQTFPDHVLDVGFRLLVELSE